MKSPDPPSPNKTDQHAVVTLTLHFALVTLQGLTCDSGFEPIDAAPRVTMALFQSSVIPTSPSWRVVLASVSFGYRLHRFQISNLRSQILDRRSHQLSLPVEFLNTRIQLAIFFCKLVSALLNLSDIDRRDVFHLSTREATLRDRGHLRQVTVRALA